MLRWTEFVIHHRKRVIGAWLVVFVLGAAATSNLGSIRVLEKCGFTLSGHETEFDERLGEKIEEALFVLKS